MRTPTELLQAADDLLNRPDLALQGAWPRAVALLGRQALEGSLDQFWEVEFTNMKYASRRTQTLCLEQFIRDRDLTDGIRESWAALSRACHHHPFELSPTAAELKNWLAEVEGLISRLSGETSRQTH